jgi:hypothetical protein
MKLLEVMSNKIDGVDKLVIDMCIYLADYALNKTANQTMKDFPML